MACVVPLNESNKSQHEAGQPRPSDWLFLLLLGLSLVAVVWVGQMAYREGVKTEQVKRLGEAWLAWLQEEGERRTQDHAATLACARQAGMKWGTCAQWLQGQDGPFHDQLNPFNGQALKLAPKCDFLDRQLVGALVLEKLTPTPPGSAVPMVISPLQQDDPIDAQQRVRVTVCDKGAGPIGIGETEF